MEFTCVFPCFAQKFSIAKIVKRNFILSGVSQGSMLSPILFNIFLNDLFLCIKRSDLHTFADDNTITATCNTLTGLLKTLEQESESAVSWFKQSKMIVNANKFQAIILNKKVKLNRSRL